MHKILEKTLVKKYPKIFKDYGGDITKTCMGWGLTCGRGWFLLLDELCSKIKDKNAVARQVKEKFGTLRFYVDGDESVHDIVSEYEHKSGETCEDCGEPAKVQSEGGWLKCVCNDCNDKRALASKIRSGGYIYSLDEPGHIIVHDLEIEIFSGTINEFMDLMTPYLNLIENPMSTREKPLWEQI